MSSVNFNTLKEELNQTKNDSLSMLDQITNIHTILSKPKLSINKLCTNEYQIKESIDTDILKDYRNISTPMIYSAWESVFTTSIAVCFRALKDLDKVASDHSPKIRAIWLQQEDFFKSYIDMIKNIYDVDSHKSLHEKMANMKRKINKGHFALTENVLQRIDLFNNASLNKSVDADNLVMTFSNVDKVVTELNMHVIGLNPDSLDLSKLNSLVGKRNSLGHGEFTSTIGERQFGDLVSYTKNLIQSLLNEVLRWLEELEESIKSISNNMFTQSPVYSDYWAFEYP
ncbi:hypothetical protein KDD30_03720 [Photobacterium sp. GJ3]|uniref:MAE_28990/MAE_18760 family HEPN-like nuclease n=1 Tax=Photobacterium sp. GJ3 TaxID=2829502 RepID=UPI001B8DA068|nr:MAE_28990/MAE_18760 family HEPN-like nuclease [Photobacterium sp. GJ3]QUJ68258.1 hypothetical protein KDD30_03720 [Photobacterium sp. GJ3]